MFVVIPLLFYYRVLPNYPLPFLVLCVTVIYLFLRRDASFDRRHLWKLAGVRTGLKLVLIRAAVLCTVIGVGVWLFMPERLFSLVRRAPLLWASVMVLYPLLSVYPQELFFRAFFFHRYRRLFGQGVATVDRLGAAVRLRPHRLRQLDFDPAEQRRRHALRAHLFPLRLAGAGLHRARAVRQFYFYDRPGRILLSRHAALNNEKTAHDRGSENKRFGSERWR